MAKQIQLYHLEWTSCQEIRDKVVTFFNPKTPKGSLFDE